MKGIVKMYSNTHKFIFLHFGKCAGSSIKKSLASIDGLEVKLERGHADLGVMKKLIKQDGFNPEQYFKFSCARNPWDRMVSLYHHMSTVSKRWPNDPEKLKIQFNGTFEQFVNSTNTVVSDYSELDYIIRYESLQCDFDVVCDRLNIERMKLPCIDYDTGRPTRDYQSYYYGNLQHIVAEKYVKDIEYFGYKFET